MKSYRKLIIVSIGMYILLAFLSGIAISHMEVDYQHEYRVESNRIINQIKDINEFDAIDLNDYKYIQKIEYMDKDVDERSQVSKFYTESNQGQTQILPFYQENELQGYLKFIYRIPEMNANKILILMEGSLLILEVFILIVLWYLDKKMIQPFQRLNEIPEELAKGHFKGEIKEEKSRYFGRFMWGMSQLKDTLDVSQKRQLELLREKKQMLLSLSHDMKTPLNLIKLYNKALNDGIYTDEDAIDNARNQIDVKVNEIEKYIDEIIKSSREDILDLQVNDGEFYLKDLIEKVLSVYEEQCKLRHIDLIVHPFENKIMKGDFERSQEVFENLFENAFKYGDGKRIEISFAEEDYCQLIHILNTGEVISDTDFNHIFESFYQGTNSKGQRGNGLGLYICRELMLKMGGTIFANRCDEGMVFTLVFR